MNDFPPARTQEVLEHEYDTETSASTALIRAICVCENVDPTDAPTDFNFVLHDHVDPAALDELLGDGTGEGETVVSFTIPANDTYFVEISDDGRISIQYAHSSS